MKYEENWFPLKENDNNYNWNDYYKDQLDLDQQDPEYYDNL
jgi:hypothetical protein